MIARMCERAGIDAVWVRDGLAEPAAEGTDAWAALMLAAAETRQMRLGAMLDLHTRGPDGIRELGRGLPAGDLAGRLEITLCGDHDGTTPLEEAASRLRRALLAEPFVVGVEVHSPADLAVAARLADDVLLLNRAGHDLRAELAAVAAACAAVGRPPVSLGVAVQLPVSIGRTETEAQARAADEPLFAGDGDPARGGIFGTLEMCQDRVIELAHAGVTDLRCVLPNSPDVHDVIAQLTAMVVGSVDVLQPGAPRSRAPEPPTQWGGRSRFPRGD
jgi:alkanesulfonate monooxygenase SsuD/methylene tetrahydromethanopterin reductase-like flavin-dependent oxidoreductase (luciferase family)